MTKKKKKKKINLAAQYWVHFSPLVQFGFRPIGRSCFCPKPPWAVEAVLKARLKICHLYV